MAHKADGTHKGDRSAVGPDRGPSAGASVGGNSAGKAGKSPRDVPSRDGGGNGPANADARTMSSSGKQGQSVHRQAEDPTGQQSGKKRRRSRKRRKRGGQSNVPSSQAQTGVVASPKPQEISERSPTTATANRTDQRDGENVRAKVSADQSRSPHGDKRSDGRQSQGDRAGHKAERAEVEKNSERKRNRRRSRNRGNADQQPVPSERQQNAKGKEERQDRPNRQESGQNRSRQDNRRPRPAGSRSYGAGRDSSRPAYAALDLGTNNCRLLVAEPHGQSFRVVDAFSRIVRLGEGLSQTGRLSEEAQDRAISALKVCQSKLSYRSVKRFRLIATEACRRAANGSAFLNRVYRETGLKLEIVNRETEARLAVSGCASLVHPEADGVVLFDIGGGSSEIVWLDLDPTADEGAPLPGEKRNRQTRRALRHMSERIRCWTSLQVGVVTLSEKHGGHIVDRDQFETMVNEVRDMLHDFEEREALAKAIESKHIHMLGTSGTVTTLAGVHLGLERYDRRLVDGAWLNAQELRDMISRILEMDFEERTNNPCIGQDRADLVLAGCAILEAFHREWPCARLRVADRGLREGILMEMMIDDGVWNPRQGQNPGSNQGKKQGGKKRRSRRRGGRAGQRGGHANKAQETTGSTEGSR